MIILFTLSEQLTLWFTEFFQLAKPILVIKQYFIEVLVFDKKEALLWLFSKELIIYDVFHSISSSLLGCRFLFQAGLGLLVHILLEHLLLVGHFFVDLA